MLMRLILLAAVVMIMVGLLSQPDMADRLAGIAGAADGGGTAAAGSSPRGPVAIPADRSGHFFADASVRGRTVRFMVDTGASAVVLTSETARRLNFDPKPQDFVGTSQTANGSVPFAPVMLPEIRIGSISVRDVQAIVLPRGALETDLLGMTFLRRLGGFRSSGQQLILTP